MSYNTIITLNTTITTIIVMHACMYVCCHVMSCDVMLCMIGQTSLRRVLLRYAVVDEDVGYCQGMGFIAAILLTYMSEDEAFWVFHRVLTRPSAPLRLMYLPKLIETQKVKWIVDDV